MEYHCCSDFTIDSEQEQVYIRDLPYIKVFSFDGHFIKTILLEEQNPIRTIYLDGKLYLFNLLFVNQERTSSFWSVIDTTGKTIDEKSNFDVIFEGNGMTYGTYPYRGKDHIGYWNHFNDTVFHIYNDEIKPVYVWSKENYRLTVKNSILEDNHDFLTISRWFDTRNFLYISYSQYGKSYICIYNKSKDQFSKMSINAPMKEGITNNIDQGLPMKPNYFSVIYGEEYFAQTVYPSALIEHLEKSDVKDQSLLDFVDQITEEDNQIITLYKLKSGRNASQ